MRKPKKNEPTKKELALAAVLELEAVAKKHALPVIVIVGLPETGETIKMCGSLHGSNLAAMMKIITGMVEQLGKPLEQPKEGGQ